MTLRILLLPLAAAALATAQDKPVDFQREVRPILSDACFACHGPDSSTRMANLRLDKPGPAIVPGKPSESKAWLRISHAKTALRMPPPQAHKTLTDGQKDTLRRWIEQGAEYKEHWAFSTPSRPAVPPVKQAGWARNDLDRFLLARMEAAGLSPAAEADRRVLARRAALDLTGLPPAPQEVEAFVRDTAADAYERYVDRMIAKPQYGEHRARYWLDAARYADTHGLHVDNYREMWPYRDWVIEAFNKNVPFDRFTLEQLAGDLLEKPTMEQKIATGFHRCNITTNEGGSIEAEVESIYAKDRVDTTGAVWLGLTVGCATCHDHKFDPISQREFYQMAAFFRNTTQKAMDGNIHDTPPVLTVPADADRGRWEEVRVRERELRDRRDTYRTAQRDRFRAWLAAGRYRKVKEPFPNSRARFTLDVNRQIGSGASAAEGSGAGRRALAFSGKQFQTLPATNTDLDAGRPFSIAVWIYQPSEEGTYTVASRIVRPEGDDAQPRGWLLDVENRRPKFQMFSGKEGDSLLFRAVPKVRLKAGAWNHLTVTSDGSRRNNGLAIYVNGQPVAADNNPNSLDGLTGSTLVEAPLRLGNDGAKRYFDGGRIEDLRIFDSEFSLDEAAMIAGFTSSAEPSAEGMSGEAWERIFLTREDKQWRKLTASWRTAYDEQRAMARRAPVTHVMSERRDHDPEAFILFRGMYDQPRDRVVPEVPSVAGSLGTKYPRNRLGLAQWLMAPENPLTARVTVNRMWQEIFGSGLVRTAEDFGAQGTPPTHPELLDWLAVEFRESGWDMKRLVRMLVTSAAYRQSAATTELKQKTDPENLLLSRGPRFRMDGEMVRDFALSASGLLVPRIGGPSVKPYQPEGIWETVAMKGSNTRFYEQDHGEALYRRSLYTFWKRSAPPASMEIFNAPTRETCTVRRERTNTPLQALVVMNDVQFVEAARVLAEKALLQAKPEFDARLDFLTTRTVSRSFGERERTIANQSLRRFLSHYDAKPDDARKLIATGESPVPAKLSPAELAAWTMLASQMMNLDEALNK